MSTQEEGEMRVPTQEEIKRARKQAAMELADYKKRIKESVELKRLQVEELELNVRFYYASKEYEQVEQKIMEEEAKRKAEKQQKAKSKIEIPHVGEARTEEEIEEAKKV